MKTASVILIAVIPVFSNWLHAENNEAVNPVHKYWICAISSYYSVVNGEKQNAECQVNTEYSVPPCRQFVVEYEGINRILPHVPFEQTILSKPFDKDIKGKLPTKVKIEINPVEEKFIYKHTVEQSGTKGTNKIVYNGFCVYNEAPVSEKIFMDYGLKTAP